MSNPLSAAALDAADVSLCLFRRPDTRAWRCNIRAFGGTVYENGEGTTPAEALINALARLPTKQEPSVEDFL